MATYLTNIILAQLTKYQNQTGTIVDCYSDVSYHHMLHYNVHCFNIPS